MIISGAVSVLSMRVIVGETNSAIDGMLQQVQRNIDDKFQVFKEIAYQLSLNRDLQDLMRADSQLTNHQQYGVYRLTKQLASYVDTNQYIENIYVYHRNTDSVICKDGKMSWAYFYDRYFDAGETNREALLRLMQEAHITDYRLLDRKLGDSGVQSVVALFRSLPFGRADAPMGALIISMPMAKIQEILSDVRWIEAYELLMVESGGGIFIADGPRHVSEEAVRQAVALGSGRSSYASEGRSYEITVASSGAADWQFVVVMPSDVIWEKTTYIRAMTLYSVLLCMLAGGIVAYFFARKNYDPIHKMARALTEKKALAMDKQERGYRFIHAAVNENIEEIRTAYSRLEKQDRTLRSSRLQNLLKGNVSGKDGEALALEGSGPLYAVLLFCMDGYGAFETDGKARDGDSAFSLAMFAFSNVLDELIREDSGRTGDLVEMEGMLACVVHFRSADIASAVRDLDALVSKCQAYVREQLHIVFSVAISDFHSDRSKLAEAYREASDAMGYRKLVGGSEVIRYESIANPKYQYDYSMQTETVLVHYLKLGDLERSRELVDEVLRANLGGAPFSGDMARCLMSDLTGTIVKTMFEICDKAFIDAVQPLKRLTHSEDIMAAKSEILCMLEILCEYVQSNPKSIPQFSKAVTEYIKANYADPNLSTSAIGEKFNLTRAYLSTLFKSQTDQTMTDYISRVRLDKAKELLRETNQSIKDVAERAGFSNSSVFIRTFKKYEGITPGEYREIAG